ncbi:hypothetical protein B9Q07_00355 [Candidatus Marsarchaeota G2 archaeon ECH_B_3]|uniref:Uncharacterized protein n=1 Tax=Candidatus Marsarchaeota G2 archaeon ECH_B_3 TaxID=1978161 RepID=A0A2R6BS06_9ARCH|nr:MAG: hypothetical protein B9Q07_00355 [Candidatus Marsarchaeota G2 archaeon ECH_B_3]
MLRLIINPVPSIEGESATNWDVLVQSKALRLPLRLSSEYRITSVYITHDVGDNSGLRAEFL